MRKLALLGGFLASIAFSPAHAELAFQNNYDGNLTFGAGISGSATDPVASEERASSVGPWNAAGWSGQFYRNYSNGELSELTLTGLKAHTQVNVSFLLGFLDSWDSNVGGWPQGDNLDVLIDGIVVATLTANNASGPNNIFAGGTPICAGQGCQIDGHVFYSDTLVDMSTASFATFAHTGSTLRFGLRAYGTGWQGGADESWGVDNIVITYNARNGGVPEPAAWAMMLAGFGMAGAAIRRRKAHTSITYA